jgi:glycosyltransferase involved in cell wall biosynthesis
MRILIGITKSNFGGAQRYVLDLALANREAGHDVAVLCGGEGPLVDKLTAEGIRVIPLPILERNVVLKRDYKNFFSIFHILKVERPDVFHLNSSKMGGLGSLAARVVGIPRIIFTGHSFEFNAPRPWYQKLIFKFLYWLIFLLSHKVICVSERARNCFRYWPLIQNKLVVIHNGVKVFPLLPRAEAREKLVSKISPETLLIGTLAELHKVKGLDVALQAFASRFKNTSTQMVIVGSGEEEKTLKNLINELGLEPQVHLKGFLPDASALLSGLDIFFLSSRSEGLPYALLEAGVSSLPVVVTRVGGIPEIVKDNYSGYLVPANNPYFLGKAFEELSEDKSKRERFGLALHDAILKDYDQKTLLQQTIALYK